MNKRIIRDWIEDNDRNLSWLARQTGIKYSTIYGIFHRGWDDDSIAEAISRVTGIPVTDILGREPVAP